mgnify:FL=1
MVLFTGIFGAIDFYLRIIIKRYFVKKNINRKIILVNEKGNNLIKELEQNQNIGYEIVKETENLNSREIIDLKPDLVVLNLNKEQEFS